MSHLFSKCDKVNSLRTEKTYNFSKSVELLRLAAPNAYFGYLDKDDKNVFIQNLVLLVFSFFIDKSIVSRRLNLKKMHPIRKGKVESFDDQRNGYQENSYFDCNRYKHNIYVTLYHMKYLSGTVGLFNF